LWHKLRTTHHTQRLPSLGPYRLKEGKNGTSNKFIFVCMYFCKNVITFFIYSWKASSSLHPEEVVVEGGAMTEGGTRGGGKCSNAAFSKAIFAGNLTIFFMCFFAFSRFFILFFAVPHYNSL
jgi:hypothetical protein